MKKVIVIALCVLAYMTVSTQDYNDEVLIDLSDVTVTSPS